MLVNYVGSKVMLYNPHKHCHISKNEFKWRNVLHFSKERLMFIIYYLKVRKTQEEEVELC